MEKIIYESIYDKLIRHGYVYIEESQVSGVLTMVSTEIAFSDYTQTKGITVNKMANDVFVKFTINDWKPYSSNTI